MATYLENISVRDAYTNSPVYNTPIQEIFDAVKAKTSYYVQGLSKIKNGFDSALSRNLTNETNINNLWKMKEEANKQLKNVVNTDLSISDNVSGALKIFDPIVKNKDFRYDEYITNTLSNSEDDMSQDANKKGKQYVNFESVRALNNTKNKLRTTDVSINGWEKSFLVDPLDTKYMPYDPEISKKYETERQKKVKDMMSKYSRPYTEYYYDKDKNPIGVKAFYLEKTSWSSIDDMELRNWELTHRPEQENIQDRLRAKNDMYDIRTTINPLNTTRYIGTISSIKDDVLTSEINIINRTITNTLFSMLGLDAESPQYEELNNKVETLKGMKADKVTYFNGIDVNRMITDNIYGDEKLAELYRLQKINSSVAAAGLDVRTRELSNDTSATYIHSRNLSNAEKQAEAARKQAEKNANSPYLPGSNNLKPLPTIPDETLDPSLSDITNGENIITGYVETNSNFDAAFLNAHNTLFNEGFNINFKDANNKNIFFTEATLNYLKLHPKATFEDFLNSGNHDDSQKNLMKIFVAAGYSDNISSSGIPPNVENVGGVQLSVVNTAFLRTMNDPSKVKVILNGIGLTNKSEEGLAAISAYLTKINDLTNSRNNLDTKMNPIFEEAKKESEYTKNLSLDEVKRIKDGSDFVKITKIGDQFKKEYTSLGFTEDEADGIVAYKGGYLTLEEFANKYPQLVSKIERTDLEGAADGSVYAYKLLELDVPESTSYDEKSGYLGYYPVFSERYNTLVGKGKNFTKVGELKEKFTDEYEKYKTKLNEKAVLHVEKMAFSNSRSFGITANSRENGGFDPTIQIYEGELSDIFRNAASNVKDEDVKKVWNSLNQNLANATLLQSIRLGMIPNTNKGFFNITFTEAGAEKLKKAAKEQGVEEKDINNFVKKMQSVRFNVDEKIIQKYGVHPSSSEELSWNNGATYKNMLLSGETVQMSNVGVNNPIISVSGKFFSLNGRNGTFYINETSPTKEVLQKYNITDEAKLKYASGVLELITNKDTIAYQLYQLLKSNGIDTERFTRDDLNKIAESQREYAMLLFNKLN